jgi:LPXTG-motif cell wall-anchored protein
LDGGIRRQYEINPSGCSGLTATVALKYEDNSLYGAPSELKGLTETGLKLYRWTGSAWVLVTSTQTGGRRVISDATQTSFSPWTIAYSGQVPTALTLTGIRAQSEAGFPWVALAGAGMLLGGAALWATRRRVSGLSR